MRSSSASRSSRLSAGRDRRSRAQRPRRRPPSPGAPRTAGSAPAARARWSARPRGSPSRCAAAAAASATRSSSSCAIRNSSRTRSAASGARSARACSSLARSAHALVWVRICSSAASASSSKPTSVRICSARLARVLRPEQPRRGDAQRAAQQPQPLLGVGRRGRARVVERRQRCPTRRPRRPAARDRCARPRSSAPPRTRARTTGRPAPSSPRRCSQIWRASAKSSSRSASVTPSPAGRRPQQHLVGRQQARPLLRVPVQRQQRQRRAAVARVGRQDALVGLERPLGLIQLLLRDQRDPLEQPRARRHVGGAIGQRRQLIAQIAERAVLGVERFERRVVARLGVDLAQRPRRARVLGLQLLDALEDLDRRLRRAQPLVAAACRAARAAPARRRRRSARRRSAAGARGSRSAPASAARDRKASPGPASASASRSSHRQHLVVERDRLAHVVQAIAGDARHLDQPRPPRRPVRCGSSLR